MGAFGSTGEPGNGRRERLRTLALPAGALVAVWLVVAVGLRVSYAGRVLPGTTIGGLDVGGRSPQAAARVLCSRFALEQTMTLTIVGRRFVFDARQLGYRCDLPATTARVRRAGRQGMLGGLWSTVTALIRSRRIEPVARVDHRLLSERIAAIAGEVDRKAMRGDVVAAADAAEGVRVVAPRAARKLDRGAAAATIRAALLDRRAGPVALAVSTQPPATAEQVRAVARRTRAYVRTSIAIRPAARRR